MTANMIWGGKDLRLIDGRGAVWAPRVKPARSTIGLFVYGEEETGKIDSK
jgi:hypothetical protein